MRAGQTFSGWQGHGGEVVPPQVNLLGGCVGIGLERKAKGGRDMWLEESACKWLDGKLITSVLEDGRVNLRSELSARLSAASHCVAFGKWIEPRDQKMS
eukprot:s805_g29.t2